MAEIDKCAFKKFSFFFSFWMTEHLSSRALLKPQPPISAEINPIFFSSLQTAFLFYFTGITFSLLAFAWSRVPHVTTKLKHSIIMRMI